MVSGKPKRRRVVTKHLLFVIIDDTEQRSC